MISEVDCTECSVSWVVMTEAVVLWHLVDTILTTVTSWTWVVV